MVNLRSGKETMLSPTASTSSAQNDPTTEETSDTTQPADATDQQMEHVIVPSTQLTELLQIATRSSKTLRAPRYSDKRDLSDYLADFRIVAERNRWSDLETGLELQNSLEGTPLSIALSSSPSGQEIMDTLEERLTFTPKQARRSLESIRMVHNDVDDLAKRCRRLTELGYGPRGLNVTTSIIEEIKVESFMEGLRNRDMVHALGIQRPTNLKEAVQFAKEFLRRDEQFSKKLRCMHCEEPTTEGKATASGNGKSPRQ